MSEKKGSIDDLEKMWSQQLQFMKLLATHRGWPSFPVDITEKKSQQLLDGIIFHIMKELFEVGQLLQNTKSHRITELKDVDVEHLKEELSDVLHLFIELCAYAGISREDLVKSYLEKGETNTKRIENGY